MKWLLPILLILLPALAQAYEVRLSEQQLQQELEARMPLTRQQGIMTLVLSEPLLTLQGNEERVRIRSKAQVSASFGLNSQGQITVDGKVRYDKESYSFFIDDPRVVQLSIDGLSPALEPQLIQLAQQALRPALENQPVYTLSDEEMTQAMARMMLKSLTIEDQAIVLVMSPF